jgi:peptide/nickel transport system substrate-binding protein
MAAQRLHPAREACRLLEQGPAEARRGEVQHRAGIGDAPGRLVNGQYALLPNIDAATALQLKGKPNVKIAETLELAYTLIGMNTSKPPFDNPKVREALNYALNRRRSSTRRLRRRRSRRSALAGAEAWALDVKEFPCYTHDPAKAQALLKEAGVATPVAVT